MIRQTAAANARKLGRPQAADQMLQDMEVLCGGRS